MLPEDSAFISGMRGGIMELAELPILQLIRGQHDMTIRHLDLPFFKQEIEELVRFGDIKIVAFLDSSPPRIWHHHYLLASIPFSCSNLFIFIFIAVIDWVWIISFGYCGTFLERGISVHTLELAIERCYSLSQLTQVVKFLSRSFSFNIGSIPWTTKAASWSSAKFNEKHKFLVSRNL